ncbi:hypothetical protein GCM10018787_30840 [Streptomyces thermodiastaticus]|nr:hypothetical protein GCM10018787_30840 [Streptomyces thermodiastaticus]
MPERLGGARLNDPGGESNALDSGRARTPQSQGARRAKPVLRPPVSERPVSETPLVDAEAADEMG